MSLIGRQILRAFQMARRQLGLSVSEIGGGIILKFKFKTYSFRKERIIL